MLNTYKATSRGDHLEWRGEAPEHLAPEQGVAVYVTILDDSTDRTQEGSSGERMVAALEKLAASGAFQDVTDPVAWQREIRRDRPLPGRDGDA